MGGRPSIAISVAFIFCSGISGAQNLFTPVNVQQAIEKGTRTSDGLPGKNYWQNSADYKIKVWFDPRTRILKGEESITYHNNSPDDLYQLVIRLYPDLFKRGVQRNYRFDYEDENDGVEIQEIRCGDEMISVQNKAKVKRTETLMYIIPKKKIEKGSSAKLYFKWQYTVNKGSHIRTGEVDSTSFFIAYFFPRISVYDDINGWDEWNYKGMQEFYNDFCNFDVEINIPKRFTVWATGDLQNASDNFHSNVLKKLEMAGKSSAIINVIDSTDYIYNTVYSDHSSGQWHYTASNITDFVFALSDHYLWQACTVTNEQMPGKKVLVSSAFNPDHSDYFEVAGISKQCVELMNTDFPAYPFPFPKITVFDGLDQMEYPMMVNDNPTETRKDAVQLVSHEVFHSYFPFMMGINETQYAWMDEGWATLAESVLSPIMGEPEDEGIYGKRNYERIAGTENDIPTIVNTEEYAGRTYQSNSYGKPGICYWVLSDMLGNKLFLETLHAYMDEWKGRHPTPYDFFNSFNRNSGRNLNWFWQKWFFGFNYPDLAIGSVTKRNNQLTIKVINKGGLPLPVFIEILLSDRTKISHHLPASIWQSGKNEISTSVPVKGKVSAVVIGHEYVPDKYIENNRWTTR